MLVSKWNWPWRKHLFYPGTIWAYSMKQNKGKCLFSKKLAFYSFGDIWSSSLSFIISYQPYSNLTERKAYFWLPLRISFQSLSRSQEENLKFRPPVILYVLTRRAEIMDLWSRIYFHYDYQSRIAEGGLCRSLSALFWSLKVWVAPGQG